MVRINQYNHDNAEPKMNLREELLSVEIKGHHDYARSAATIFVALFTFLATTNLLAFRDTLDKFASGVLLGEPGERGVVVFFLVLFSVLNCLGIWATQGMVIQFKNASNRVELLLNHDSVETDTGGDLLRPKSPMPFGFAIQLARIGQVFLGVLLIAWVVAGIVMAVWIV